MHKVLIVDDEILVLDWLTKTIPWKELNMSLISTAEDGESAFEKVKQFQPDILITDIYMPLMDGLDLINRVKCYNPDTEFVILSGIKDFEYAQKAIEFNVNFYILKPSSNEELINVLKEVSNKINNKRAATDNINKQSLIAKRDACIINYISTKSSKDLSKSELFETFKLQKYHSSVVVVVLTLDDVDNSYRDNGIDSYKKYIEALKFIREFYDKESKNKNWAIYVNHTIVVMYFIENNKSVQTIKNEIVTELMKLQDNVKRKLQHTISVGIGRIYTSIELANISYAESLKALNMKFHRGKGSINTYFEILNDAKNKTLNITEVALKMLEDINAGNYNNVANSMDLLYSKLKVCTDYSINKFHTIYFQLLVIIENNCLANNIKSKITYSMNKDILFQSNTLSDLNEKAKSEIYNLVKFIKENYIEKNKVINLVCSYISNNLDSPVTLSEVANYVKLSSPYLSELFKREMNVNFTEYVINLKMQKAKDMIVNTNSKVSEVSESLGFSDSRYFSQIYKRKFGKTPTDYRNAYKQIIGGKL